MALRKLQLLGCCVVLWTLLVLFVGLKVNSSLKHTEETVELVSSQISSNGRQLSWHLEVGATKDLLHTEKCNNTVQGVLLADSHGFLCNRKQLNTTSGCCLVHPHSHPFDCGNCDRDTQCCSAYEHCVSCCLGTEQKESAARANDLQLRFSLSVLSDPFELCKLLCRTSSKSLVHENAYRSSLKHCFGSSPPPLHTS